ITRMEFVRYLLRIPLPGKYQREIKPRLVELTWTLLRKGEQNLEKQLELWRRTIFALSPITFILVGSGLGLRLLQKNRGFHIGVGALTGLLFFLFMMVGEFLAYRTGTPFPLWLPVFVFGVLGILLWR
ncbi:MAG: LptF/LptG family permease, partial [Candidatus Omnitrophica bacterium]|nr:LptF/LptG family permease [Candidatus Omnitrophota bacterium]